MRGGTSLRGCHHSFCNFPGTPIPVMWPVEGFRVADLTHMCRPATSIASVGSVWHIAVLVKLQEAIRKLHMMLKCVVGSCSLLFCGSSLFCCREFWLDFWVFAVLVRAVCAFFAAPNQQKDCANDRDEDQKVVPAAFVDIVESSYG